MKCHFPLLAFPLLFTFEAECIRAVQMSLSNLITQKRLFDNTALHLPHHYNQRGFLFWVLFISKQNNLFFTEHKPLHVWEKKASPKKSNSQQHEKTQDALRILEM